jgi:pimeloyl-ACP methyl ester carboxylesterase
MSGGFTERRIDADGAAVRCLDAGQGATVVALRDASGAAPTALETLLAEKFRIVVLESPAFAGRDPREAARVVAGAVRALGLARHALIAGADTAAAGLCHAMAGAAQLEALVLVSPASRIGDLEPRFGDVEAATLVLTGTRDKPAVAAAGRLCADQVRDGYFMVVYDAGPGMENERPAALFEAVADFLERRGRFVLERQDSALSP